MIARGRLIKRAPRRSPGVTSAREPSRPAATPPIVAPLQVRAPRIPDA